MSQHGPLSPIKATPHKFDPTDENLEHLLESNRQWAEQVKAAEPDFFEKIAQKQEPKILWIGMAIPHAHQRGVGVRC